MDETIDNILYEIRGAILDVQHELGPGLLESVYEAALVYELKLRGLNVKTQQAVPIYYQGELLDNDLRLDIIVEDQVIIELKAVDTIQKVHYKQLRTYLKLMNKEYGLLVNFNTDDILKSMHVITIGVPVG